MSMLAWLTPNSSELSAPETIRTITLSSELWHFVSGALYLLTQENNWELYGDASIEDVTQYFIDILESFNDEAQLGDTINFINGASLQVVNESSASGNSAHPVYIADLPVEYQGAKALIFDVRYSRLTGASIQQLIMSGIGVTNRVLLYDDGVAMFTKGQYTLPVTNGGCLFRLIGAGNTVNLLVHMVGWVE